MNFDTRLYLVTDRTRTLNGDFLEIIEGAITAGVTMVQLREKDISACEFYQLAAAVKKITRKFAVPLWINDRIDIALAAGADGVHLGQSDIPAAVARKIIPRDMMLGISASTVAEAIQAEKDGASLIGVGAIFPTSTKSDADYVTQETLYQIKDSVSIPVVAIGGINAGNAAQPIACGADGVAVSSAIMYAESPTDAAREIRDVIDAIKRK